MAKTNVNSIPNWVNGANKCRFSERVFCERVFCEAVTSTTSRLLLGVVAVLLFFVGSPNDIFPTADRRLLEGST